MRPLPRPALLAALAFALGGCLPALPHVAPEAEPAFDPIAFFEGRTEGLGVLDVRTKAPVVVQVESVGTPTDDGLELRQVVRHGDDPETERTWVLQRSGPGTFSGTLTDAEGPVEATVEGNTLHIRYRMGGSTTVAQDLTLQPGGDLALNLMTVRPRRHPGGASDGADPASGGGGGRRPLAGWRGEPWGTSRSGRRGPIQ